MMPNAENNSSLAASFIILQRYLCRTWHRMVALSAQRRGVL